jgi:hypothetical protein
VSTQTEANESEEEFFDAEKEVLAEVAVAEDLAGDTTNSE